MEKVKQLIYTPAEGVISDYFTKEEIDALVGGGKIIQSLSPNILIWENKDGNTHSCVAIKAKHNIGEKIAKKLNSEYIDLRS